MAPSHSLERPLTFTEAQPVTGLSIAYEPQREGGAALAVLSNGLVLSAAQFSAARLDEAHILYMEATEILASRAKRGQSAGEIRQALEALFALFRGEKPLRQAPVSSQEPAKGEFKANPGKALKREVNGSLYERLPVKTRLIEAADRDILPLIDEYVAPFVKKGDLIFVSEKALTVTQNRIVDFSRIRPTPLAHALSRRIQNNYGTASFRGFGHGTALAMQLLIDEAGVLRVIFAAAVAALTRPLGIRGMFYRICGARAKSIDCPMSFTIIEYAHCAKLAPLNPGGVAKKIKEQTGCEAVILDANYRGAFSLGKSSRRLSERFIQALFADNPLGQSDEMTPFCIVRKVE